MDSMLRWITAVLLLVVALPQHSCDDKIFSCTDVDLPEQYWVNGNCTLRGSGLLWNAEDSTLIVEDNRPVTIRFELTLKVTNPSPYYELQIVPVNESDHCPTDDSIIVWKINGLNKTSSVKFTTDSRVQSTDPSKCNDMYMTVKFAEDTASTSREEKKSGGGVNRVALALGISAGVAVIIFVAAVLVMRRRLPWHRLSPMNSRNSKESDFSSGHDLSDLEIGTPRMYSYKDLSSATHSFSSKYVVGEGGFGTVYKGVMKDSGSPVAIKRLSQYARQGAREFVAEVKIISQLRHRNLVQLLGWCLEKDELILVYEYMPNGDLDDLLYADNPKRDLLWKSRYNILGGVATALVYLHEEWIQRVVHRDVKTSNVMLDSNLNARLGDFGLARLSAHSQAPQSTLVAGTLGYLAPEFSMSGKATDKTDVYAFGVVALEVTCARRPLSPDLILVDWVWDLYKQDRVLDAVDPKLDPKVRSSDEEVQITVVLQIALLCCHPDPNARPTMRQVLNILTGEASVPRVPRSKPVASYFEDD